MKNIYSIGIMERHLQVVDGGWQKLRQRKTKCVRINKGLELSCFDGTKDQKHKILRLLLHTITVIIQSL